MNLSTKKLLVLLACCGTLLLAGCKGHSTTNYTISVTVSGLIGSGLVLQDTQINNVIDNLSINSNGVYTFTNQVANNASYSVAIITTPNLPPQTCTLSNATGTATANVTNITVVCLAPEFAYVTNSGSNSIASYVINSANGALTSAGSATNTGSTPTALAINSTGRYAYVVNSSGSSIAAYLGNLTNGSLVATGTPLALGYSANALVVDTTSQFVFATNASANMVTSYKINIVQGSSGLGTISALASMATGIAPSAITVATVSGAEYLYVTNQTGATVSAYVVNTSTGGLTATTGATTGVAPVALAAAPNGQYVYVVNASDATVSSYSVTPASGALTPVAAAVTTGGTNPVAIAVAPKGNFVYVANAGTSTVTAYSSAAGVLTNVGVVANGSVPSAISVDPSGSFVYVANASANSISLYQINATTGALSGPSTILVGSGPISVMTLAQ